MKKGWGIYYKLSKLGKIPRLPGMWCYYYIKLANPWDFNL
jgi:hypothetical protein